MQLAEKMYQRKLEEDRRNRRTAGDISVHSRTPSRTRTRSPANTRHTNQDDHTSTRVHQHGTARVRRTDAADDEQHQPHPPSSSLTAFFHSHPLTSKLSPIKPNKSTRAHTEEDDHPQRRSSTSRSPRSTARHPVVFSSRSVSPSAAATVAAAAVGLSSRVTPTVTNPTEPEPSALAVDMLNHSIRIAQSYAHDRRARTAADQQQRALVADEPQPISVPDSPFSSGGSGPLSDLTAMTPTTRKIHRLLAIQNPAISESSRAYQERDDRAKENNERTARLHEMHDQRKRDLAAAEIRARQTDRRTLHAAYTRSNAHASNAVSERLVESSTRDSAGHSHLRRLAPPPPPTRAKTPSETYVPPPFSYRTASRASQPIASEAGATGQPHDETPHQPQQQHRYDELHAHAHDTSQVSPMSNLHATPPSAPLHTSFTSPLPSRSTLQTPHSGSSSDPHQYAAEDAEVLDLFNLRSPASIQHQVDDAGEEHSFSVRSAHASHNGIAAIELAATPHARDNKEDDIAAATTTAEQHAHVAARPAQFEYTPLYAPRDRVSRVSAASPSLPSIAASLESKIATLHQLQLERELANLVPAVLKGLTHTQTKTTTHTQMEQETNQTRQVAQAERHTPPHTHPRTHTHPNLNRPEVQQSEPHPSTRAIDTNSRLSQPAAPIAVHARLKRTDGDRELQSDPRITLTESTHHVHVHGQTHPDRSRYAGHVHAYAERRQWVEPAAAAAAGAGAGAGASMSTSTSIAHLHPHGRSIALSHDQLQSRALAAAAGAAIAIDIDPEEFERLSFELIDQLQEDDR